MRPFAMASVSCALTSSQRDPPAPGVPPALPHAAARIEHASRAASLLIGAVSSAVNRATAAWDTSDMAQVTPVQRQHLANGLALLIPALLFGCPVSAQWPTQLERSSHAVRYNAPLTEAAESLQNAQNTLKAQLAELRKQLDSIQANASTQTDASRSLQARIDDLKARAGLTAVAGDGVIISLDDAKQTAVNAKDVDKSICHNTDLTDIVNTAWRGGAQAIAINDERIVGTSSVYCVGSTIMVNGTLMSPPFSVAVIGSQNELLSVYDDPNELRDIKQRRDVYGLGFRVARQSGLRIPAYRGAMNVRYGTAQ